MTSIRAFDETDDQLPEKNIPLFRKAVEWVEEQDELDEETREWNQHSWVTVMRDRWGNECGTAYCVAGYVCHINGWVLQDGEDAHKDGVIRDIQNLACELLGIDEHLESTSLFAGSNTAREVRMYAEELCGERL